jgi:hypothetical protein|tara:strand:- start:639 stop:1223 length:585 start_codon:yes stop_codon:yes gene_type:complete
MAQSKFIQSVLDSAKAESGDSGVKSVNWFREKIQEFGKPGPQQLLRDGRRTKGVNFGTLNMFIYSPKHKDTLPYYDTFPLVLPIGPAAGGFMGLNFHYLPIQMRIRLLDKIVDGGGSLNVAAQSGKRPRLITDYSQLKRIPMAKAIVKHYLTGYVKSDFRAITSEELIVAALLPVQRFQKGSAQAAYLDTAKRY